MNNILLLLHNFLMKEFTDKIAPEEISFSSQETAADLCRAIRVYLQDEYDREPWR